MTIHAVAEGTKGATNSIKEILFGIVAFQAGEEGTVIWQKSVSPVVVSAVGASRTSIGTVLARVVGVNVTIHADTIS